MIALLFALDPGRCPPHDASVYIEVNQRTPNIIQHVVHCIKAMRMSLTIAVDKDAERDYIYDWSSVNVA